ncbi:MAG: bifunctional DNA-formamidopyrimidine glycosylase/DNA-(apurinic or apyrimidinic site) lyase [Candidatus Pacebacteria bacterium]|nr:bifunctional DNA-formamidopyrimidine glycosylase/DNA-(apurinic or apyrimidinic site) lyase [Candidatus Paceibacterota bacterium]
MPELPEVESLRLGLKRKIIKSKIIDVKIIKPKLVSGNSTLRKINNKKTIEFKKEILNEIIIDIKRIAKNLILELSNEKILIIHLKMTGQLVFVDNKKEKTLGGHPIIKSFTDDLPNKHTAIIFNLDNGTLFYNDVRMFGYVLYFKNILEAKKHGLFKNIGLDPFDKNFTLEYFKKEIIKKNKNLKSVLLEQKIVTGCGNIYTDEVCFASKVLPERNCKNLKDKEIKDLYKYIKSILNTAIENGGSSVSDYLLADGSKGNYARFHKVYGKGGKECKVCKNILEKKIISGRATVFCRYCQK